MPKSSVAAASKLSKAHHILREQVLELERKADIVETGIVRTDRDIHARFIALSKDRAQNS